MTEVYYVDFSFKHRKASDGFSGGDFDRIMDKIIKDENTITVYKGIKHEDGSVTYDGTKEGKTKKTFSNYADNDQSKEFGTRVDFDGDKNYNSHEYGFFGWYIEDNGLIHSKSEPNTRAILCYELDPQQNRRIAEAVVRNQSSLQLGGVGNKRYGITLQDGKQNIYER